MASSPSPVKTSITAKLCRCVIAFPKNITENKIVKSFRVVVMTEHVNGPKFVTVVNMKC